MGSVQPINLKLTQKEVLIQFPPYCRWPNGRNWNELSKLWHLSRIWRLIYQSASQITRTTPIRKLQLST